MLASVKRCGSTMPAQRRHDLSLLEGLHGTPQSDRARIRFALRAQPQDRRRDGRSRQQTECVMSISQEAVALREHWLAYLIEGILLVVLGAAAIVVPSWATL